MLIKETNEFLSFSDERYFKGKQENQSKLEETRDYKFRKGDPNFIDLELLNGCNEDEFRIVSNVELLPLNISSNIPQAQSK